MPPASIEDRLTVPETDGSSSESGESSGEEWMSDSEEDVNTDDDNSDDETSEVTAPVQPEPPRKKKQAVVAKAAPPLPVKKPDTSKKSRPPTARVGRTFAIESVIPGMQGKTVVVDRADAANNRVADEHTFEVNGKKMAVVATKNPTRSSTVTLMSFTGNKWIKARVTPKQDAASVESPKAAAPAPTKQPAPPPAAQPATSPKPRSKRPAEAPPESQKKQKTAKLAPPKEAPVRLPSVEPELPPLKKKSPTTQAQKSPVPSTQEKAQKSPVPKLPVQKEVALSPPSPAKQQQQHPAPSITIDDLGDDLFPDIRSTVSLETTDISVIADLLRNYSAGSHPSTSIVLRTQDPRLVAAYCNIIAK